MKTVSMIKLLFFCLCYFSIGHTKADQGDSSGEKEAKECFAKGGSFSYSEEKCSLPQGDLLSEFENISDLEKMLRSASIWPGKNGSECPKGYRKTEEENWMAPQNYILHTTCEPISKGQNMHKLDFITDTRDRSIQRVAVQIGTSGCNKKVFKKFIFNGNYLESQVESGVTFRNNKDMAKINVSCEHFVGDLFTFKFFAEYEKSVLY